MTPETEGQGRNNALQCIYISFHLRAVLRDWSLITGRGGGGGATKREGGGHVKFYPYERGGGRHKKFWGSLYAVA